MGGFLLFVPDTDQVESWEQATFKQCGQILMGYKRAEQTHQWTKKEK
jgi:hypothetical protein